jgi:outer membrane protein assembly factor BamB
MLGMSTTQTPETARRKPLRIWPGILIVAIQWFAFFILPALVPEAALYGIMGGVLGGAVATILWWLFFSRARWSERLAAIVLMPAAVFGASYIVDKSILTGAMGFMLYLYAIPVLCLALVVWAAAAQRLSAGQPRFAAMVGTILAACGLFALVRTGGMSGEGDADLHWRWTPTPEERLLAMAGNEPGTLAAAELRSKPRAAAPPITDSSGSSPLSPRERRGQGEGGNSLADKPLWPGFRGPNRDGIAQGVQISTDWSHTRPVELWRHPIGPGWSSFAVQGDLIYTQEQRGDEEIVACYELATGKPVWMHKDHVRFWESNGGAGPRATPTLGNGRVYTLGATGIVNALSAVDGSVAWSRNAAADTGAKVPHWGFAGSPLLVDDLVIVATGARLAAYDSARGGKPRWLNQDGKGGYSSPHLVEIGGMKQVIFLCGTGAKSIAPTSGKVLWKYDWSIDGITQPALSGRADLLIGSGSGLADAAVGVRCIEVAHTKESWTTNVRWTSTAIKPYFNDFVVHKDHAYGFDGSLLACIDLADGKRKWKGGRYGHGQVIVLPDQDLLIVLSEKGELALVEAKPDHFTELAKIPAIEGKTWNHPVLAGNVLLARNGEEMAAFRLSPPVR